MTTTSNAASASRHLVAVLIGVILGQLATDKSVPFARFLLWLSAPTAGPPDRGMVGDTALIIIFLAVGILAPAVAVAVRHGRLPAHDVVLSGFPAAIAAVFVASFLVIEFSLPVVPPDTSFRASRAAYFLAWVFLLWAPLLLLPRSTGTLADFSRRAYGLLTLLAPLAAGGFITGLLLHVLVSLVAGIPQPPREPLSSEAIRFWIAHPAGLNAIGLAYVPVASASLWWRELGWAKDLRWAWPIGFTLAAVVLAGLFGLFPHDPTACCLRRAAAFGAFPLAATCAIYATYALTRPHNDAPPLGWGVSKRFWSVLPVALAAACAITALLVLAPLHPDEGWPRVWLVAAHALNGLAVGVALRTTKDLFKLMSQYRP